MKAGLPTRPDSYKHFTARYKASTRVKVGSTSCLGFLRRAFSGERPQGSSPSILHTHPPSCSTYAQLSGVLLILPLSHQCSLTLSPLCSRSIKLLVPMAPVCPT